MADLRVVNWDEISRDADFLFRVWTDGRELHWAKKCWETLCNCGLTSYTNQIERTFVIIRLITLADVYRKFCELAFDEVYQPEYATWADEINLGVFRVAQCVGPQFECYEEAEGHTLLDLALCELVESSKPAIYEALKTEFGDDSLLFVSLWNTLDDKNEKGDDQNAQARKTTADEDYEIDWAEDAQWILNTELSGHKLQAFNWVCQGFTTQPMISKSFRANRRARP